MWIRDSMRRWRMKDPVRGDALVVACNASDWKQNPQMLRVKLVVEADGVPKATVKHSQLIWAPSFVWPDQGSTVPVVFDRADPTRLRIDRREHDRRAKHRQKAAEQEFEKSLVARAYGHHAAESGAASPDPGEG